jgi:hypothetical protein
MLTRLKLTRGEGQLVEPSSYPTRRKQIHSPQVSERHSPSMAHAESHERVPAEEEDLRADYHTVERYDEDLDGTEHNVAG